MRFSPKLHDLFPNFFAEHSKLNELDVRKLYYFYLKSKFSIESLYFPQQKEQFTQFYELCICMNEFY